MKKLLFLFLGLSLSAFFLYKSQAEPRRPGEPQAVKMSHTGKIQQAKAFFADGNPKYMYEYLNGLPHGFHEEYFENGRKYLEIPYRNGKKHGWQNIWSSDGKAQHAFFWIDGVLILQKDFPIAPGAIPSPRWKSGC